MSRNSIHTGPERCIAHPWVIADDGCFCDGHHPLAYSGCGPWCEEYQAELESEHDGTTEA